MIKIAYTIPNFETAGSGMALMKLVLGLDKTRFEPHIVCLHSKGVYFEKMVKSSGIPVHIYPYLSTLRPIVRLIRNCWRVSRFFKKQGFDIVFSYHYGSDYSEAISAKLARAKFVYVKKNMSWYGPSHHGWQIKTLLADAIVAQNKDMLDTFFCHCKKAAFISIGVDTSEYFHRERDVSLLNELGLNESDRIILAVANLVPKKGIDYLLKAFVNIDEGIKLVVVGDTISEYGQKMVQLSHVLGLDAKVIFTGKRYDVPRFYSIAHLFILPSTSNEGAPITVQEAMASGVVVITTDTPGNRDQLSSLPNQLISPCDESAISRAITKMLSMSPEQINSILNLQMSIVNESYSLSNEIKAHEKLYLQIMTQ